MILPNKISHASASLKGGEALTIRPVTAQILEAYAAVLSQLAPVNLDLAGIMKAYGRLLVIPDLWPFAGLVNDHVISCATLFCEPKLIREGRFAGRIEDVVVDAAWRGKHVGEAMILHLVNVARFVGCRKITLSCADANVGFYTRCGFRPHEHSMRLDL